MLIRKYLIPAASVLGLLAAVVSVQGKGSRPAPTPPIGTPARAPFESFVAGAGLVEASSRNIAIGTQIAGVVAEVHVQVGARVKKGDPLFTIDQRDARASIRVGEAAVAAAEASLSRLKQQPRVEEIPAAEARVRAAEAELADAENRWKLVDQLLDKRAISEEDRTQRQFAVVGASARVDEARASLQLLKAGAWAADVSVAEAALVSTQAELEKRRIELDRHVVRAPIDGQVLQVEVEPGEFAALGALVTPLMLVGATDVLHVRVDIDESDAWRLVAGSRARASLKGNGQIAADLEFVRIEPYVVPKRSLTGGSNERVDTRVVQVIYAFAADKLQALPGQQVDVFVESNLRVGSTEKRSNPGPR